MGSSLSPCSMWYILVTVELHGPCYGKQDIYNYEPSVVRVSTVGAWDAIFYIIWSSIPAWWLESVPWVGDILTAVQGLEHILHSLKIAHMGQTANKQLTMAVAQLLLCLIKHATEAGMATQQKVTCVRKELKMRKDIHYHPPLQPLTWWVNWIKGKMRQRY